MRARFFADWRSRDTVLALTAGAVLCAVAVAANRIAIVAGSRSGGVALGAMFLGVMLCLPMVGAAIGGRAVRELVRPTLKPPPLAPPGWYPHPSAPGAWLWWNGRSWTAPHR